MILLDSNIIIYLRDVRYTEKIAMGLRGKRLYTCNIIMVEVLGYKGLTAADSLGFADLFSTMNNVPFDEAITKQVIAIRKTTNIQLADAIIAATAIVQKLSLWTSNTEDFTRVDGLEIFDPLA